MLHACAVRFDMTGNLKKLFEFRGEAEDSKEGWGGVL